MSCSPARRRASATRWTRPASLPMAMSTRSRSKASAPCATPSAASRCSFRTRMRALQIEELDGPDAVKVVDAPEPEASHFSTPGQGVVIEVKAAAGSFPDVLQSRGLYQFKPDLPFVPGAELSGVVVESSHPSFEPGQRVAAM